MSATPIAILTPDQVERIARDAYEAGRIAGLRLRRCATSRSNWRRSGVIRLAFFGYILKD